jgi:hypothetical protein
MTKLAVKVSRATSGLLCLTPAAVVVAPAAQACDACGGMSTPTVTAPAPIAAPVHPVAPIAAPSFSAPTPISPTTSTLTISPANSVLTPGTNSVTPNAFSRSSTSAVFTQIPQFQQNLTAAQAAYDAAATRLADAQNASKGPVRYARIPSDLADCGCLNTESASNNSADLTAAQAGEAEAAARLTQVQTETRQFLENTKAVTATNNNPIW